MLGSSCLIGLGMAWSEVSWLGTLGKGGCWSEVVVCGIFVVLGLGGLGSVVRFGSGVSWICDDVGFSGVWVLAVRDCWCWSCWIWFWLSIVLGFRALVLVESGESWVGMGMVLEFGGLGLVAGVELGVSWVSDGDLLYGVWR